MTRDEPGSRALRIGRYMIGVRQDWARHHHNGDTEPARGVKFATHRLRAGILCHQHLDSLLDKQGTFVRFGKRAARRNDLGPWRQMRGIRRLDATDDVEMPGSRTEGSQFLAADGQEHAPWRTPESGNASPEIGHHRPVLAGLWFPSWTPKSKQRNATFSRRPLRMPRNLGGEGMGGIDQRGDPLATQIIRHPGHAAESAQAMADRWQNGQRRAPGKRKRRRKPMIPDERAGKRERFPGATQDKNTERGHFRGISRR